MSAPLVQGPGSDSDLDVSDEDLDFVGQNSQRLGFLTALDKGQLDKCASYHFMTYLSANSEYLHPSASCTLQAISIL